MSGNRSKNSKHFEPLFVKEENDLDIPKTEVGAGATEVGKLDSFSGSESKPILPLNVHGGGVKSRIDKKAIHNGSPTVEDCQSSSTASADEDEDTENDEEDEDGDEDDDESSTSYETESSEDSGHFPGTPGTETRPDVRAVNLVIGKATVGNPGISEVVKIQTSKARPQLPHTSATSKCEDKQKSDQKANLTKSPSNDTDLKKSLQKMPSMDFKSLSTLETSTREAGNSNENNSGEGSIFQLKLPETSEDIKIASIASGDAMEKAYSGGAKKRSSQSRKNFILSAGLPPVPPTSPLPSMIFQAPMCNSVYGVNPHDHSSSRHLKLQCGSCSGAGYRNYDVNRFIAQPPSCVSHSVRSILSPVRQTMQTCSNEGTVYSLALEMPVSGSSNLSAAVRRKKQGKKRYPASLPDEELGCICSPFYVSDMVRCACELQSRSRDKTRREKLWTRASIERDCSIPSPSGTSRSNRHSSYTPRISAGDQAGNVDHAETPAKSAAHSIHLSRPTSPQSVKLSDRDKTSCNDCSNRTFPRSLSRGPSNCRHCHLFCSRGSVGSIGGSLLGLDYEDRLLRLESDKDTLHLQVSVLSDQIEAQTSKIQDLEKMLDDKRNVLETTEEQLQRELVTRSGLETQKLELITEISGLRLKHATLERENLELKGTFGTNCVRSLTDLNYASDKVPPPWNKPPIAGVAKIRDSSPHAYADPNSGRLRLTSIANDNIHSHPPRMQTPPSNASRRIEISPPYGTMPRLNHVSMQPGMTTSLSSGNATSGNKSLMNATKPNSLSSGNLNHIDHSNSNNVFADFGFENKDSQKSNKGGFTESGNTKPMKILRILGKLRRSNSGALDAEAPTANGNEGNPPENKNPFVRGGFRATAAPRLGWGPDTSSPRMPDGPITAWDSASVVNWLNYLGLGMYSNEMRRWVKSGQQLLDASPNELEKELGVKNSLHRKKLSLALYFLQHPDEEDNAGRLDYHWVTRWLDDVGLPQYKEAFADARIDGRVLSHLTTEDLINLKVTSLLHHVSLKRGIQILRIHRFHPGCLCRRGSLSEFKKGLTNDPKYVATWTNHRVMEWLKAVDLAEYAPNLRGSGVHGALIVLEPKFNAELLAVLLSIPTNKTLLRRHLCQQFHELCGKAMVEEKRAIQLAPEFLPISLTAKVKHIKKTFPLRKKSHSNEAEELLCPPELGSFPTMLDSRGLIFPERSEAELPNDKTSNL